MADSIPKVKRNRDKTISRHEIESLIAEGDTIVIYHNKVLKLNNWVHRHPGGNKPLEHMIGRDASDEMDVYHSEETLRTVGAFQIGKIQELEPWVNFTPPIQGGSFRTRKEIELDEGVVLSDDSDDCCGTGTGNELTSKSNVKKRCSSKDGAFDDSSSSKYGGYSSKTEQIIEEYDQKLVAHDLDHFPSLDYNTQLNITTKFRQLHKELQEEGLFQCTYWGYLREFSRISLLFCVAYYFFNPASYRDLLISAACLGFGWHQITFIVHDAGHLGITHDYWFDNILGIVLADFIGGLSVGWWKRNHNVHHIVTNDPVNDPDIQHLPFFAVSTKFLGNVKSTFYEKTLWYDVFARALIPFQSWTYFVILTFARFNLYRLSWEYLLLGLGKRQGKGAWFRYLEIVGVAFFAYWYGYGVLGCCLSTWKQRWLYMLVSHIATMPVHVQITLSHFAMSTSDVGLEESFMQRQLRTTMDVDCPAWLDFIHGGLQFQVIHHLFPRMPRHNLRAAQDKVKQYCQDVGLEYCIYGFTRGNIYVVQKLGDIAKQARILAECTKYCQDTALKEGHL